MKTIETLVDDINSLLDGRNPITELPEELAKEFGRRMEVLISNRLITREQEPRLRISNIGKPCERQVWLGIHESEKAEPLRAETRMKFLYGDLIEDLLLFLAEVAGHRVEGFQDQMEVEGVLGSRDAVIDGVLVDVKSASTYSFKKFQEGKLVEDDPFGYIGQIQTYLEACQEDPIVTDKSRCAFLVMDKTLGTIYLDIHPRVNFDVKEITRNKVKMINGPKPERTFEPIEEGKGGNMVLPMTCSYCSMKFACYDNLRTFIYAGRGPKYFTKVVKEPNVPEITNQNML